MDLHVGGIERGQGVLGRGGLSGVAGAPVGDQQVHVAEGRDPGVRDPALSPAAQDTLAALDSAGVAVLS